MRKVLRKRIIATLALATSLSISAGGLASAKADEVLDHYNSSPNQNNAEDNIFSGVSDVFIKDGAVYVELIENYSSSTNFFSYSSNIGVCPSKFKTKTVKKTRAQLITLRNQLEGEKNIVSTLIGFLIPGWIGSAVSAMADVEGITLTAVKRALDTTKSNFTVTSKWSCKEINFGIRGIVHRYKLEYVIIR